jgi:hypothetical protein
MLCQQAAQHLPLFQFVMSQGPNILTQRSATNITSLLPIFKEGVGSGFLQLTDIVTSNRHVVHSTMEFHKLSELTGSNKGEVSHKVKFL